VQYGNGGGRTSPRGETFLDLFWKCTGITGQRHRARAPEAGGLGMSVAAMNATPTVDHPVRPKRSEDTHPVGQHWIAPHSLCLFCSFGEPKIRRSGKEKLDAVTPRCGKQFLRADQSELRSLLRAKIVLATLAAGEREQRHIGVQPTCQVREERGGLV